ncbi:MAG TPA: Asp-tRNA(Asn)/Glu-tRNA(Gln) amidotransferase subunit GatB, partial [Roseiflexaceae bacterium]|nr:Asp-tRNA(Asn)/Glu-tRNA(Gln) amidotransferase subunit GatB [Roseiflexaceae bacterium]
QRAIERAILTGLALNCRIQTDNVISRKNYFYPDLPSGYQRSQYEDPLCVDGWVTIEGANGPKRVGLTRVHIEEDTGKLNHMPDGSSLVDYNRAGVPLMEIVSEPEIDSPEEARRYFQKLRQILLWIGVNSGNMEEGALRCDANVSVRPEGQKEYGSKVEIKNINSFRAVERALVYEIERQIGELEAGRSIPQSTRGWDDERGVTLLQRVNEGSADYRYFPEPDIPPLRITEEIVEGQREQLPELPDARRARFVSEYGLPETDADVLTDVRGDAEYFERAVAVAKGIAPKEIANWVSGELFRLIKDTGETLESVGNRFPPEYIAETITLLANGTITRTSAKEVFEASYREGIAPAQVVKERGLEVIGAGDALATLARQVVDANPKVVADYRSGKVAAIKFLVGQVMKATKGQANPQAAQEALEAALEV